MSNEISSGASNNVILKSKKMTNEELKNRIKCGEKYVQIHKTELESRRGNSKTSNKLVDSKKRSKPLEKKSGGKKPTNSSQKKTNKKKSNLKNNS